jgi:RND family efflux transporter MFP subunit
MGMKKRTILLLGGMLLVAVAASVSTISLLRRDISAAELDPRQQPPLVRLVTAARAVESERRFTGTIAARVQSNLGFRVPGKVTARLVDVGQQVKAGQALMRLDNSDLRLVLTAKRNAVVAARAAATQARADERRYAALLQTVAGSPQRYDQAKAALDMAVAQLAAAEAEARVAENETAYSTLTADADGIVVETLAEPGQVVVAGQAVVRLAHAGPREALVSLPEAVRPGIGSRAEARVYGNVEQLSTATLRQLSDAADPQTRTYEARYVLDGEAAEAPLGATVMIRFVNPTSQPEIQVPLGALRDGGSSPGVWVLDTATSTVNLRSVKLLRMTGETAVISGVNVGERVVSLGAHLLHEGASVRTVAEKSAGQ